MHRQEVQFFVPGIPVPQGSMTKWRRTGGISHASKKLEPWRQSVAAEARREINTIRPDLEIPWSGPIILAAQYLFRKPQCRQRKGYKPISIPGAQIYCAPFTAESIGRITDLLGMIIPSPDQARTVKPDLDKLTRAIGDALDKILYTDDSQIAIIITSKMEI